MRLGIATSSKCPQLIPAEQLLVSRLTQFGIQAMPFIWNDPAADRMKVDAVLVRSIWDYHLHPDAFLGWLSQLEKINVPVWNQIPVLKWNHHKFYLRDLAVRGVDIVPTLFCAHRADDLVSQVERTGWKRVVAKPAVSASSYRTQLIDLQGEGHRNILVAYTDASDFLIQPFFPEIEKTGEVSMIFFNGEFSHAVQKRPAPGEFRVQAELGGHQVPMDPGPGIKEAGHRILQASGFETLYARVDGIVREGRFLLMELELIEPDLFLTAHEKAIERFAEAITKCLGV
jgi:glutathione synthase/RimK-type ligase-like ATP-grasp enzyme